MTKKTRKAKDTTAADVARCARWIAEIDAELKDASNWTVEKEGK